MFAADGTATTGSTDLSRRDGRPVTSDLGKGTFTKPRYRGFGKIYSRKGQAPASTMDASRSGLSNDTVQSIALDAFERLVVVLLFVRFAFKMLAAPGGHVNFVTVLILFSEILPVIFILSRRRSDAVSRRLSDWLLGISGAIIPLLVSPTGPGSLVPLGVCAVIMLVGLYLQISAKVSLGQSFGLVAANRGVRVIGPYRFVRHPMYAGYMIAHIGFWLAFPSLWNTAFYAAEFAIQVARLLREERFLRQDQAYRAYAARVRYRLLPAIF